MNFAESFRSYYFYYYCFNFFIHYCFDNYYGCCTNEKVMIGALQDYCYSLFSTEPHVMSWVLAIMDSYTELHFVEAVDVYYIVNNAIYSMKKWVRMAVRPMFSQRMASNALLVIIITTIITTTLSAMMAMAVLITRQLDEWMCLALLVSLYLLFQYYHFYRFYENIQKWVVFALHWRVLVVLTTYYYYYHHYPCLYQSLWQN